MPPPSIPRLRKPAASAPAGDGTKAAATNPLRQLRASDLRSVARLATQATTGISRVAEGVHQSVLGTLGLPGDAEPGRTRGLTGLVYQSLREGTGPSPKASDTVRVHYRGTFPESGKEFDSSLARGEPIEFPLKGVIPCWTEGVQKMKVGGKAKLTCPASIAYGSRGAGSAIPPNATLNFEVELLQVK